MTPEAVTAIGAIILSAITAVATWRRDARMARKDDIKALESQVAELREREENNQKRIIAQQDYIAMLRHIMIEAGLQVPPPTPHPANATESSRRKRSQAKAEEAAPPLYLGRVGRMTLLFFEGVVIGFLAHQVRPYLLVIPHGPREWLAYVVGVVSTWPTAMRLHDHMGIEDERVRFSLAYFTAFVAVGIGVVAGWIFEIAMTPIGENGESGE